LQNFIDNNIDVTVFPLIEKAPWSCAPIWTICLWRIKFLRDVDGLKFCYYLMESIIC